MPSPWPCSRERKGEPRRLRNSAEGSQFVERILVHLCGRKSNRRLTVPSKSGMVKLGRVVDGVTDVGTPEEQPPFHGVPPKHQRGVRYSRRWCGG